MTSLLLDESATSAAAQPDAACGCGVGGRGRSIRELPLRDAVPGDWNDNGVFTPALPRPSNMTMYFQYTNTQGNADTQFVPQPRTRRGSQSVGNSASLREVVV